MWLKGLHSTESFAYKNFNIKSCRQPVYAWSELGSRCSRVCSVRHIKPVLVFMSLWLPVFVSDKKNNGSLESKIEWNFVETSPYCYCLAHTLWIFLTQLNRLIVHTKIFGFKGNILKSYALDVTFRRPHGPKFCADWYNNYLNSELCNSYSLTAKEMWRWTLRLLSIFFNH